MSKDLHLYQVEDGWLETFTGEQFHFLQPLAAEIHVEDVAHSLSQLCRYNGHTKAFYSVAEHSILICDWIAANFPGASQQVLRTALLHDVAETYLGDMSRPVKHQMPQFKELEHIIEGAAAERFDIELPFPAVVEECDARILVDEREQCMSDSGNEWGTDALEPLGVEIKFLDPPNVRRLFMERFFEHGGIA